MMWVFLSVTVICISLVVWKYIDESCHIDMWAVERRFDRVEKKLSEISKLLKEGVDHE